LDDDRIRFNTEIGPEPHDEYGDKFRYSINEFLILPEVNTKEFGNIVLRNTLSTPFKKWKYNKLEIFVDIILTGIGKQFL
jgi:hypothetical protein